MPQREFPMHQTAKIFTTGRSQAVRLPLEYRFDVPEVFIRHDPVTGKSLREQPDRLSLLSAKQAVAIKQETRLAQEIQFNRKVEINAQLRTIRKELDSLTNLKLLPSIMEPIELHSPRPDSGPCRQIGTAFPELRGEDARCRWPSETQHFQRGISQAADQARAVARSVQRCRHCQRQRQDQSRANLQADEHQNGIQMHLRIY